VKAAYYQHVMLTRGLWASVRAVYFPVCVLWPFLALIHLVSNLQIACHALWDVLLLVLPYGLEYGYEWIHGVPADQKVASFRAPDGTVHEGMFKGGQLNGKGKRAGAGDN
jgi:hypothetical protein